MKLFTQHTPETAPPGAAEALARLKERYGFIPNLAAYVSESPLALNALWHLASAFDKTSFSEIERQTILITVSTLNECDYCRIAHTALACATEIEDNTLTRILNLDPLPEIKLNALRDFTRSIVLEKGRLERKAVQAFLDAGYSKANVFEVVLGVAMKTFTNYSNHLADSEPNPEFIALCGQRPGIIAHEAISDRKSRT